MEDAFIQGRTREWRLTKAMDRRNWREDNHDTPSPSPRKKKNKGKKANALPEGCIDILVEDNDAEEEEQRLERER